MPDDKTILEEPTPEQIRDLLLLLTPMYSARTLDHGRHPTHRARIDQPDGYGKAFGRCSEKMEIFLQMSGDRIRQASFWTDGCLAITACGDVLTSMVEGTSAAWAERLQAEDLVRILGGLPSEHIHCAVLAVDALRKAITDWRRKAR